MCSLFAPVYLFHFHSKLTLLHGRYTSWASLYWSIDVSYIIHASVLIGGMNQGTWITNQSIFGEDEKGCPSVVHIIPIYMVKDRRFTCRVSNFISSATLTFFLPCTIFSSSPMRVHRKRPSSLSITFSAFSVFFFLLIYLECFYHFHLQLI